MLFRSINDKNEINLSKTLQVAPSTYTSTNDLDQGLQQATVVSHADMINLAKVGDVYSTANCYVVNAPGWYMFPCFVKGNGIENNPNPVINNNKSVPASQTTTKSRLFMKSTDYTDIVKIETNDAYPELVWQDAPGLISDIEFNSTKEYIQFYISPETIRSGNAIIAICDTKTGNIIWSWHIWVTFWNLEELGGSLNNTQSDTIFYGHNIGTCMAATYSYVKRSVTLRFTQNVSNKTYDMTFTQRDTSFSIGHNAPYYQWGRKDPMLASDGSNNSKSCFGPKPFTIEKIQSPVSVETANQTPYVFYCNVSNWNSDSNVNLWLGSDSISKSMYDPSPVGYMMATKDILGLLQSGKWISEDNYNAYLFEYNGGTVALYANGMRNGTDGTIENNQNIGYYWCNTFYVTDVSDRGYWYMTISNTGNDFYNIGTTSGYSIRSVRQ